MAGQEDWRSLTDEDIFRAVERLHLRAEGSHSVVAVITGWGIIAFRDPSRIHPLNGEQGRQWIHRACFRLLKA